MYEDDATVSNLPPIKQAVMRDPAVNDIVIPEIAKGCEDIYRRFIMGKLIYKPDPKSNKGRIELPIRELPNPLEGDFDLSQCGDSGKYISIATGYRQGQKAKNADKFEVWIAPRFLIEQNLSSSAAHFQPIMGDWKSDAPVGVFWTWGGCDDLKLYDYLIQNTFEDISDSNLHEKRPADQHKIVRAHHHYFWGNMVSENFRFSFVD